MGLDLYLYRLSPVDNPPATEDERKYDFVKKTETNDFVFGEKWLKKSAIGKKNFPILNVERFASIYGIRKFSLSMLSSEEVWISPKEGKEDTIKIPAKTWDSFFDDKYIDGYWYNRDEIAYQRKGIDNEGWKILNKIGNCVDCADKKLVKELTGCGLSQKFINLWDKDVVFHAWW